MEQNYYQVLWNDRKASGVALVQDYDDLFFLPEQGPVEDWQPLVFQLTEGELTDYLANDLGFRLCSERLKQILQAHAAADDSLQWLPIEVQQAGKKIPCFILHFPDPPDVLDRDNSILARDFVVKPVLSKKKLAGHQVFAYPGAGELKLFVAEPVRTAIKEAKYTGMELSRAPVC